MLINGNVYLNTYTIFLKIAVIYMIKKQIVQSLTRILTRCHRLHICIKIFMNSKKPLHIMQRHLLQNSLWPFELAGYPCLAFAAAVTGSVNLSGKVYLLCTKYMILSAIQ